MEINVDVFKPSGKWYSRLVVKIPDNLERFNLMEYLVEDIYHTDRYGWMIMVSREIQRTEEASEYIAFPQAFNLENF